MSIRVMTNVWQHSKCKGADLLLLLAIADNANDDGYAWPGIESLATKTRMSQRSIQYNTKRLAAAGELVIMPQAGPKGTNKYRVIPVDDPAWGRKVCGGEETAGAQVDATEGASTRKEGVQRLAPEPSVEPSIEPSPTTTNARAKKSERSCQLPDDFAITEPMRQWACTELAVSFLVMDRETEKFKDYHTAKGTLHKNWESAWKYWMRRSVEYASRGNGSTYKAREVKKTPGEINEETFARMRAEREGRIQVDDAYETQWSYAE